MVLHVCAKLCLCSTSFLVLLLPVAGVCAPRERVSSWLPADVKFHFSILDYPNSKPLFDQTGFGQLLRDDAVRPFLKSIPEQLRAREQRNWLGLMWVDLGVDWDQFAAVPSGEVTWTVFDVDGTPVPMLCADVTGKEAEIDVLRSKIAAAMKKQQVPATQIEVDGTTLTLYKLPRRGKMPPTTLVHFVRKGYFVATQNIELAKGIVTRVGVRQANDLSGLAAYKQVMSECQRASDGKPHAELYLVPFDCLELLNDVARRREIEVERPPEIYRSQGFDALAAIGATIVIGGPDGDFSFRASLFAPKPWSKSMKMVDLRNGALALEKWVHQGLAACSVLNLHAESVYANIGPFFDEVVAAGATGAWDEILVALRDDEDGPRLDLEKEVLVYLTGPVVVLEAEASPISPESPQVILAIKSSNEAALRAGIEKAMQDDPWILKKDVAGVACHYAVSDDNKKQVLWIACVAQNYLFLANDFDLLTPILKQEVGPPLAQDMAFERARAGWRKELPADPSTVTFYRLDRWAEVRYELARQGKRVAAHRSLSGMLNGFLGGEPLERKPPEFDGSKLPPFEQIRKYFGTFDAAVVTVENGWLLSGHVRR